MDLYRIGAATPTRGELKALAKNAANQGQELFILTVFNKDGSSRGQGFQTRTQLDDAFGLLADHQADFTYVAAWDKTDKTTWPNEPVMEFGSDVLTAVVTAKKPTSRGSITGWLVAGGVGLAALIGFSSRKKKPVL